MEQAPAIGEDRSRVCLGVVTAPHGVRGLLRIKSFTADPEAIGQYGPLENERGEPVVLELVGAVKGVVLARLDGVADRDAAERLKGMRLFLPRERLPEPGEDEFYHTDLLGLAVEFADGTLLGRVRAVHDFGAGDSIEIEQEGGAIVMVPFSRAAVPVVDIAGGRIVVEPPEGLFAPLAAETAAEE